MSLVNFLWHCIILKYLYRWFVTLCLITYKYTILSITPRIQEGVCITLEALSCC